VNFDLRLVLRHRPSVFGQQRSLPLVPLIYPYTPSAEFGMIDPCTSYEDRRAEDCGMRSWHFISLSARQHSPRGVELIGLYPEGWIFIRRDHDNFGVGRLIAVNPSATAFWIGVSVTILLNGGVVSHGLFGSRISEPSSFPCPFLSAVISAEAG